MEWIKVEDKLPSEGELVLMSYDDVVKEGIFSSNRFCYFDYGSLEDQEGVTHWMPFPEPPKEI